MSRKSWSRPCEGASLPTSRMLEARNGVGRISLYVPVSSFPIIFFHPSTVWMYLAKLHQSNYRIRTSPSC